MLLFVDSHYLYVFAQEHSKVDCGQNDYGKQCRLPKDCDDGATQYHGPNNGPKQIQ